MTIGKGPPLQHLLFLVKTRILWSLLDVKKQAFPKIFSKGGKPRSLGEMMCPCFEMFQKASPKHRNRGPRGPLVVVTWQITPVLTRQITLVTSGWRLGFASTYPSGAHYCRSAAFQQLWCEKDSDVDKVWTFSACPKHELKDWYWMVGYDIWYLKRWLHERYLFMDGSNPTVQGLWPKEIFDMPSTHEPPKKKIQVESNAGNIYPNALISNIASSINFQ